MARRGRAAAGFVISARAMASELALAARQGAGDLARPLAQQRKKIEQRLDASLSLLAPLGDSRPSRGSRGQSCGLKTLLNCGT